MCFQLNIKELDDYSFEYERSAVAFILFVHATVIELILDFLFRSISLASARAPQDFEVARERAAAQNTRQLSEMFQMIPYDSNCVV